MMRGISPPGYWMHETTGVLRPAVEAFLNGGDMTGEQIAAMRAYLRQWIECGVWRGWMVSKLRVMVDDVADRQDIETWLRLAEQEGIDPL